MTYLRHLPCFIIHQEKSGMKRGVFCLLLVTSLAAAPAIAFERDRDQRDDPTIELKIHSGPERYTFRDYISDVKESTRIAQTDSKNPVRELEARKNRKSEPLNPIVIRW